VCYHLQHFWSRFGSEQAVYTYRCNRCQQISQANADFTEIILSFPQDRSQISLNELIHRDFGMEQLDDKLCANCNNSDTSEVTTSIHTHPDILIIMLKHHEYINNKPGRVYTQVNFPINGFVPNQGLENVKTTTEYNLFAAICHKESKIKLPDTTQHNARSRIVIIIGSNMTTQISSQIISSIKEIEQRQSSSTILWHTFYST
jgi:ubiquitin C-terminal hydrolase